MQEAEAAALEEEADASRDDLEVDRVSGIRHRSKNGEDADGEPDDSKNVVNK